LGGSNRSLRRSLPPRVVADENPAITSVHSRWVNLWEAGSFKRIGPAKPPAIPELISRLRACFTMYDFRQIRRSLFADDQRFTSTCYFTCVARRRASALRFDRRPHFLSTLSACCAAKSSSATRLRFASPSLDDLSSPSPRTRESADASGAMTDSRLWPERDWQIAVDDRFGRSAGTRI